MRHFEFRQARQGTSARLSKHLKQALCQFLLFKLRLADEFVALPSEISALVSD
jgi:hypothetical protein